MQPTFAFIPSIGWFEWMIILFVGLLIFGRKLPEVGRGLGRAIVEFKKGIKGIEDDAEESARGARADTPPSLPRPQPPADSRRVSASEKLEESA